MQSKSGHNLPHCIIKHSNAVDFGSRGIILEAVGEIVNIVRGLTRRVATESNAAMRAVVANAIREAVVAPFGKVIVRLHGAWGHSFESRVDLCSELHPCSTRPPSAPIALLR